jgi:tight adherence protein B
VGRGLAALLLGLAGLFAPLAVVYGIREKRSAKLSEQLPDALDMMARSLRAGHALPSAFKLVASEMPAPVSVEFGIAFEEQNLGMSFDRAIQQMTRRAPSNQDLKIFAVSVIVQKETGGNLVEIIEKIAETVRARYRFFGRLRSLTAEGRVSAVVIGGLPIVMALFLSVTNPTYVAPLLETPLGHKLIVLGVGLWIVGVFTLRRMSQVEL